MDLDTIAETEALSPAARRWLAILVGVAAVTAALLAAFEADSGRREELAFVRASRSSIQIFAELAGSTPRNEFALAGVRGALQTEVGANGRLLVSAEASPEAFAVVAAMSEAESAAAARYQDAVQAMARVPPDAPIDPATRTILTSDLDRIRRILAYQNRQVDVADVYGTRQERAMFSIALVALAAVLLGLAGLVGARRGGRLALVAAASALVLAVGWSASSFFG
jgi:hypothetical protein